MKVECVVVAWMIDSSYHWLATNCKFHQKILVHFLKASAYHVALYLNKLQCLLIYSHIKNNISCSSMILMISCWLQCNRLEAVEFLYHPWPIFSMKKLRDGVSSYLNLGCSHLLPIHGVISGCFVFQILQKQKNIESMVKAAKDKYTEMED